MNSQERAFHEFAEFAAKLKGDEKSEAQTFLFHLLEAFSSQPWSGEAAVHVSIVNWIKGQTRGEKTLQLLTGTDREGPWERKIVPLINSSLSFTTDVASAK